MSSGSVSRFAAESKAISGIAFWAAAGNAARSVAATNSGKKRLMESLPVMLDPILSCTRCLSGRWLQDESLHAPGFDFPNNDFVGIAAIHHVDDLEPAEFLAGMAELPNDRPVQFQLVDLARDGPRAWSIAVGVGVGGKDVLMRALRNANGPTHTKVVVDGLRLEVVVEDLVPDVGTVGHPDVALPVNLESVRQVELTGFLTGLLAAHLCTEAAVLIELPQPCVRAAVIDEDVALGIGRDPDSFAEKLAGRNLQQVRHRRVGDFGHILRRCLLLRERRSGTQHQSNSGYQRETALHWSLLENSDETTV